MTELSGRRVVMTGATGFIGRNVARMLLEEGAVVYALVRPESGQRGCLPSGEGFHILSGDMDHIREALAEAGLISPASGKGADIFLHFAWGGVNREEIDSPVVQKRNVGQSLGCLYAAHELGCSLFMDAGSRVEYGITADGMMKESMECRPVNEYGRAKLAFYEQAGKLCGEWGMTYEHLRFFSVYGAGDHPWSLISTLTRDLPQGKKVSLSACMHRWNFMNIEDAARAVLELCRHSGAFEGETHIVNVASRDTRRLRSFVEEIHELCGGRGILEYGSFIQAKEGALSVCPAVEELVRLTEGAWREQVSFGKGIAGLLQNRREI